MESCIFCKILAGELGTKLLYEDSDFAVFADISKQANVHLLAVPKKHYATLADMNTEDAAALGRILKKLPSLAEDFGLNGGYRLVINQGEDGGQTVKHLHIHILGGQKLGWTPA